MLDFEFGDRQKGREKGKLSKQLGKYLNKLSERLQWNKEKKSGAHILDWVWKWLHRLTKTQRQNELTF